MRNCRIERDRGFSHASEKRLRGNADICYTRVTRNQLALALFLPLPRTALFFIPASFHSSLSLSLSRLFFLHLSRPRSNASITRTRSRVSVLNAFPEASVRGKRRTRRSRHVARIEFRFLKLVKLFQNNWEEVGRIESSLRFPWKWRSCAAKR